MIFTYTVKKKRIQYIGERHKKTLNIAFFANAD